MNLATNSKYVMAKDVVTRRVQGYRDSIATSDVWLPNFKVCIWMDTLTRQNVLMDVSIEWCRQIHKLGADGKLCLWHKYFMRSMPSQ